MGLPLRGVPHVEGEQMYLQLKECRWHKMTPWGKTIRRSEGNRCILSCFVLCFAFFFFFYLRNRHSECSHWPMAKVVGIIRMFCLSNSLYICKTSRATWCLSLIRKSSKQSTHSKIPLFVTSPGLRLFGKTMISCAGCRDSQKILEKVGSDTWYIDTLLL